MLDGRQPQPGQTQQPPQSPYVQSYFRPTPSTISTMRQSQQQAGPEMPRQPQQEQLPPSSNSFPFTIPQQEQLQQPQLYGEPMTVGDGMRTKPKEIASIYDVFSPAPPVSRTSTTSSSLPAHLHHNATHCPPSPMIMGTPIQNHNQQQANYYSSILPNKTPMSVSPAHHQKQQSYTIVRQSVDQQNYPCMVTVFGFSPENSAAVLSQFQNYGKVKSYQLVGNTNWMNLEYETELQAQMALAKNGIIIGEFMIGCVPMKQRHETPSTDDEYGSLASAMTPMKTPISARTSAKPTPLRQPSSSSHHTAQPWHEQRLPSAYHSSGDANVQDRSTAQHLQSQPETGKSASVLGKVMENIFGW